MIFNFGDIKKKVSPLAMNMIQDRIFARVLRISEKNEKGVYLPEGSKKEYACAVVLKIGPEVGSPIKKGCAVIFRPTAGTLIKEDDHEFIILRETELLSFVDEKDFEDFEFANNNDEPKKNRIPIILDIKGEA